MRSIANAYAPFADSKHHELLFGVFVATSYMARPIEPPEAFGLRMMRSDERPCLPEWTQVIEPTKAVETATLPQYQGSSAFMERFLDAIHEVGKEIERSRNNAGIKLVDGTEIDADCLDYFSDNKRDMESEFLAELQSKIGQAEAELFCDIIAKDWYDGRGLRSGPRVLGLKLGVRGCPSSNDLRHFSG